MRIASMYRKMVEPGSISSKGMSNALFLRAVPYSPQMP